MNWMFFRSSSALRRDPMRRRWKLLTSKTNWKKPKVRSTSQSRISRMASILYLLGPCLLTNLSAKHELEHLEASSDVFGRQAKFLPFQPFQTCGRIPRLVLHHLTLGRNSRCFSFRPPCYAPQWATSSHTPAELCLWQRVASSKSLAAFSIWKRRVWALTWCLRPTSAVVVARGTYFSSKADSLPVWMASGILSWC